MGPDDRAYGLSGDLRTYVDLDSNTMVLGDLHFENHYDTICSRGQLPTFMLSDALHELTHHWCFLSAVGNSMALLKTSELCSIPSIKYEPDVSRLIARKLRHSAAVIMLRPIAEGLALFAEFDARPGPGDCSAPVFEWVLDLFREGAGTPAGSAERRDTILRRMLYASRDTAEAARRKEGLLVHPLDMSRGGYLSGYLLIKCLWNKLRSSRPDIADPELFLCFVRSFFYEDSRLAAELLAPVRDFDYERITGIVADRVGELLAADLTISLKDFHQAVRVLNGTRKPGLMCALPGIPNTSESIEAACSRAEDLRNSILNESTDQSWLRDVLGSVFDQRDLVWLGGTRGTPFESRPTLLAGALCFFGREFQSRFSSGSLWKAKSR